MSDPHAQHPQHDRKPVEPLVKMANQIAVNMAGAGDEQAAAVAAHIKKFWSPLMRRQICEYGTTDGEGLHPAVRRAVQLLDSNQGLSA